MQSIERTLVTLAVIGSGVFLLNRFGESAPMVALVSSSFSVVLAYWFASNSHVQPASGAQQGGVSGATAIGQSLDPSRSNPSPGPVLPTRRD